MESLAHIPIYALINQSKNKSIELYSQYNERNIMQYLHNRKFYIDLLSNLAENKKIVNNNEVFYLSCSYLDLINSTTTSMYHYTHDMSTIVMACIGLAIKMIGIFDISIFAMSSFKSKTFKQSEFNCIQYLKYDLNITTVLDYLKVLMLSDIQEYIAAKRILKSIIYQDCFLQWDYCTIALGICGFIKKQTNLMDNMNITKMLLESNGNEYMNKEIKKVIELLKQSDKKQQSLINNTRSVFSGIMKKGTKPLPVVLPRNYKRNDYSTSTKSSIEEDINDIGKERIMMKKKLQSMNLKKSAITNTSSLNSSFKAINRPNVISLKKVSLIQRTSLNGVRSRNLALDMSQMSKMDINRLNSLSNKFLTKQT